MGTFLKTIGKGFLYIIALPFVLIVLAVFSVVGLLYIIYLLLKSLVLLFVKKTIFDDLPEDTKVKELKFGKRDDKKEPARNAAEQIRYAEINDSQYHQQAPQPEIEPERRRQVANFEEEPNVTPTPYSPSTPTPPQNQPSGTYIPKSANYNKNDYLDDDDIFGFTK